MAKPILLAEDVKEDADAVRQAVRTAGFDNPVYVVSDGDLAISYLKGEGAYSNRELFPFPSILLLDLNMPRVSGFEVLKWIKN